MLPSDDDKEDVFVACRYGDLEDVQLFVTKFGHSSLSDVRDENGNSILHMVSGNGHTGELQWVPRSKRILILKRYHPETLDYLLPLVSPSLLAAQNSSGSTPLHWAVLNSHLTVVKRLIEFPAGPGIDLIDVKNMAGRSPLGEAETSGWEEGAKWLVEMMRLDGGCDSKEVEEPDGDDDTAAGHDVHVKIEDADGQVAQITLRGA